jgi:hypothetical protein
VSPPGFPPYRPPFGGPAYWRDERSGVLPAAVLAYLEGRETRAQLDLVLRYCAYWIEAPCWRADPMLPLETLRQTIRQVATHAGLSAWRRDALALGIDPF